MLSTSPLFGEMARSDAMVLRRLPPAWSSVSLIIWPLVTSKPSGLRGSPSASSSAAEVSLTSSGLGLFPFGIMPEVWLNACCLAAEVRLAPLARRLAFRPE